MEKLTKSPRLSYLLKGMEIFSYFDVINHLPRRYENLFYTTEERNLTNKQRVVLLGKVVSEPRSVKARNISITTFDFLTHKNNYFKVVAYNRPYLAKTLNLDDRGPANHFCHH